MLVLDANILIRGALGPRVRSILRDYSHKGEFVAPERAFEEAHRSIPAILKRRRIPPEPVWEALDLVFGIVAIVSAETYSPSEPAARQRLRRRDESDWPILATALALDCPIWTEDLDFFGCGVATWTTDRVEIYLSPSR